MLTPPALTSETDRGLSKVWAVWGRMGMQSLALGFVPQPNLRAAQIDIPEGLLAERKP